MDNERQKVPEWATQSFRWMFDQVGRLTQTLHLSINGVQAGRGAPEVVALLREVKGCDPALHRPEALENAQRTSDFATREIQEDFPVLHGQAVVVLWAYLEALVRQLVADCICNDPESVKGEAFEKIRVRLAEYERLDQVDKAFFVVDALEKELGNGTMGGTRRFEALLSAVGLGGDVPPRLERTVLELGQVRNSIMHRGGVADRKLLAACPWLELKPGDRLTVGSEGFARFRQATHDYAELVLCRVLERFGRDTEQHRTQLLERLLRE